MEKKLPFNEIGPWLISYIKEESSYTLAEVADKTLGIAYGNFQKRLSKNNIKMHELEQIVGFLGLSFTFSLGEAVFTTVPKEVVDYEEQLAQKEKILQLQEKIIYLQDKLHGVGKGPGSK